MKTNSILKKRRYQLLFLGLFFISLFGRWSLYDQSGLIVKMISDLETNSPNLSENIILILIISGIIVLSLYSILSKSTKLFIIRMNTVLLAVIFWLLIFILFAGYALQGLGPIQDREFNPIIYLFDLATGPVLAAISILLLYLSFRKQFR